MAMDGSKSHGRSPLKLIPDPTLIGQPDQDLALSRLLELQPSEEAFKSFDDHHAEVAGGSGGEISEPSTVASWKGPPLHAFAWELLTILFSCFFLGNSPLEGLTTCLWVCSSWYMYCGPQGQARKRLVKPCDPSDPGCAFDMAVGLFCDTWYCYKGSRQF